MTINETSIMNKVKKFVSSPAGMKKVMKMSNLNIQNVCNDLINCIINSFPESIKSEFLSLNTNDWVGTPIINNNYFEIEITIPPDLLQRPSMLTDVGYEGVDNIVALLNNGYHAKCYVYGYWESKGIYTYSKKDRESLHFMKNAINDFNLRYGSTSGCHAELDEKYE